MVSSLTDSYWSRKYKAARRIMDSRGKIIKNGVPVD